MSLVNILPDVFLCVCFQRVSVTHRSYDALQYSLLIPCGEDGCHFQYNADQPEHRPKFDKERFLHRLLRVPHYDSCK